MKRNMKLIVGLGNPGDKYENSRHNLGKRIVRVLADDLNRSFKKRLKFNSFIAELEVGNDIIILALPVTFMNLSGEVIKAIKIKRNITTSNIVIVCDDVSLDFGAIRIKPKGSSGGHRGLKSVIEELKTDKFCRLRIGVKGRKKITNLSKYVLSSFTRGEKKQLDGVIYDATECLKLWISSGINQAMNRFN